MDESDRQFVKTKFSLIIITLLVGTFACLILLDKMEQVSMNRPGSSYIYCDLAHNTCSCNMYGDVPIQQVVGCMNFMKDYYTWKTSIPVNCITVVYDDGTRGCADFSNEENHPPVILDITATIR
jgi:putative exporter of polyketide antibiotics